jgi:ubiquinone biosynthesis protein UbiJ
MSTESEDFRRDIRNQLAAFQQLVAERTEEILAAIARHHEVRDRVEQRQELVEASVNRLGNRVNKLERPNKT